MGLIDILQSVVNAQACSDTDCPGSALNAIAAAFATQGYYQQADFLWFLNNTGLSKVAGLIYILAGFAGIVSMVLGSPPRNYVWFFIGPAVYNWLVATPAPSYGVRWIAASEAKQEQIDANQKEVWRIAEPGLINNNYVIREDIVVTKDKKPGEAAQVSLFFLWVDYFVSDLVENVVRMTGVFVQDGAGSNTGNTTKPPNGAAKNWSILTDLKWSMLENITSTKLQSGDMRDAFVTFWASECGDAFSMQIDDASWIAASTGTGKNIPKSVLKQNDYYWTQPEEGAQDLARELQKQSIPVPDSMVRLLRKGVDPSTSASFVNSATELRNYVTKLNSTNTNGQPLNCRDYLWYLIHAFRYEAAGIYNQMMDNAPGEFADDPSSVAYNLIYGWGIENIKGGKYDGDEAKQRDQYLLDLILVYLIRNELAMVPQPVDLRYSASGDTKRYVDLFTRSTSGKTKYAEVYSWALMVPYFQGIVLYALAMAFPFVALMVIVPGWGKGVVSWITFWIWVKSWDVGIAIVKVVERSVWGALQNNINAGAINEKLIEMSKWENINIACASSTTTTTASATTTAAAKGLGSIGNCSIPKITFGSGASSGSGVLDTVTDSFQLFDRALTMSANLNLDLTNSYYIYIMAALYFAVPGVMGQLVLGGKASAGNLIGGMVSGLGDKTSSAASSGFSGDKQQQIRTNMAGIGQTAQAKEQRQSGLALGALEQDNQARAWGMESARLSTANNLNNGIAAAGKRRAQMFAIAAQPANTAASLFGRGFLQDAPGSAPDGAGDSPGGDMPAGAAGGGFGPFKALGRLAQSVGPIAMEFKKAQMSLGAEALEGRLAADNQDRVGQIFAADQNQQRASVHGQRMGSYAGYNAESAAWRANSGAGYQMAGMSAVLGGSPGSLDPGKKPSVTQDAAMSGILGTDAAYAANFMANEGSYVNRAVGMGGMGGSAGGMYANFTKAQQSISGYGGQFIRDTQGEGFSTFGTMVEASIGANLGAAFRTPAANQAAYSNNNPAKYPNRGVQ